MPARRGHRSGQRSGLAVQAVNQSISECDDYLGPCNPGDGTNIITLTHLSQVGTRVSDTVVGNEGDSGGPWIVIEGSGTAAIAGVSSSGICDKTGKCHVAYYTQIASIETQFDETVPKA